MNFLPHLIVLVAGGVILCFIKRKYKKMRDRELIIIFILMIILVALFTDSGIDLVKRFINFIQLD
jgi:Kef-type K+ transport system membrane component KefB